MTSDVKFSIVVANRRGKQGRLTSKLGDLSSFYEKMIATASSSTVTLDHLYAKKDELPDEDDFFSNSTNFLSTWNPVSAKISLVCLFCEDIILLVSEDTFGMNSKQ